MKLFKPAYFDHFHCIASACPDSCCKEWDVDVDQQSAELYQALPTPLGDRLRQVLHLHEDGTATMTILDNRCPMWQQDGLCRIQSELGHEALCKTCREFPRLSHDYGSFIEMGLELSCPEAARIILSSPTAPLIIQELPGGDAPEYDLEAMEVLLSTRKTALSLLENPTLSVPEILAVLLLYGYQAQSELDGDTISPLDPWHTLIQARQFAASGSAEEMRAFFLTLEILNPAWKERLTSSQQPSHWQKKHLLLARYLIERYWLQAVSDYDLVSRVKFVVISCLMIHTLGGSVEETAQSYSKEIENSADNIDALLDASYCCAAFSDRKLLGLLLMEYS